MIQPHSFYDLLDCLAGQFFNTGEALCVGNEFGNQLSPAAKRYFSVAIISDNLPHDKVVLGVLLDDSVRVPSRNGYTLVIYIDEEKILNAIKANKFVYKILILTIFAHEVAHFASYYEFFIKLGDNTGIVAHSNFAHTVSVKLMGAVTQEHDSTNQTIVDEHSLKDLGRNYRNFPQKHYSKGRTTNIDYKKMIDAFYRHLRIDELIDEYLNNKAIDSKANR